jgi:hypothetical protein
MDKSRVGSKHLLEEDRRKNNVTEKMTEKGEKRKAGRQYRFIKVCNVKLITEKKGKRDGKRGGKAECPYAFIRRGYTEQEM